MQGEEDGGGYREKDKNSADDNEGVQPAFSLAVALVYRVQSWPLQHLKEACLVAGFIRREEARTRLPRGQNVRFWHQSTAAAST